MLFLPWGLIRSMNQHNRAVKIHHGTIDIIDNESALSSGMDTVWGYVVKMVPTNSCPSNYLENTNSFEKEFYLRQIKLIEESKQLENTFSGPPENIYKHCFKRANISKGF